MPERYIGLISGTSMDAVDAVLVEFDANGLHCLTGIAHPFPESLRTDLKRLAAPDWRGDLDEFGRLDAMTGDLMAEAALTLLAQAQVPAATITAIGSHGQTVRHRPDANPPFTLQIGSPARIAQATGLTVVADFRTADMAVGGQGAPLVPAFHRAMLHHSGENRVVLNLGGIANITTLPAAAHSPVQGFDTGPANTLMDHWIRRHHPVHHDEDGRWAMEGEVMEALLARCLADPYLAMPPPKSTGTEYFSPAWLQAHLAACPDMSAVNVQRTLLEFTAVSIAQAMETHAPGIGRVIVCGGGAHNGALMSRLRALLEPCIVESSGHHGLNPDWVEAMAFAWLARERMQGRTGNLPAVTGASRNVMLGGIHAP
ncbi:anhydro-N-acetylmuramic acid kinase [Ectothiorhodospira shaposhnikovii]|uniref:anhydro-N-acetylmuramic acid kinase n=1 Tax=Ectothiorhodospira shaposhnikovii TaxID=1054 RepID=UPI0019038BEF|nr:anhydro-N-acetylmuramic acid kinase [Ectothiorhodospira shaposhnikovii]MBK1673386.1 anhydro-N-acetylmuramic acid kinase [Ectothiorhodospira shaposhnikovii]